MRTIRFINVACAVASVLMASGAVSLAGDLKGTSNQADYLVICPTSYYPMAESLAAFRHEKNGLSTMVVNVDSIYAQFEGESSPDTALRCFMQYALNNWANPKPQYFVLMGNINTIPSHVEPETIEAGFDTVLMIDQWFVESTDSSGVLSIKACIARLPAWDSLSLATMLQKTLEYENDEASGTWRNRAISLADFDHNSGNLFENDSQSLLAMLSSKWTDTISVHMRVDSPCHLDSTGFVNLWDEGAAIVAYCGHANQVQLSATRYFTTQGIDSLRNGNRLPVCLLGGCDLTYDTRPPLSIPTHLLGREGGGAVAVISCEGLMYEAFVESFYASVIQSMTSTRNEPIGKSFQNAKSLWGGITRRFTLLGDPALSVKRSVVQTDVARRIVHPGSFVLEQNYPNPFNPSTTIQYALPQRVQVTLSVFNTLGQFVSTLVNGEEEAGYHEVRFDGKGLASGVYFYRLQAGSFVKTRKLILTK